MENHVHTFQLNINWKLVSLISTIDRFDATWSTVEKKERQTLKHLKSIATVKSVGASTRIEGSKMSNKEVEVLLENIDITKEKILISHIQNRNTDNFLCFCLFCVSMFSGSMEQLRG